MRELAPSELRPRAPYTPPRATPSASPRAAVRAALDATPRTSPAQRAVTAPPTAPATALAPPAPSAPHAPAPGPAVAGGSRIIATYDYTDAAGTLVFQVVRLEPKSFRVRRPAADGWRWGVAPETPALLYHAPAIAQALAERRPIYVVEGERDADTLAALGVTATTAPFGAGKWRAEHSAALRSAASVVVLPDRDAVGAAHAQTVAAGLAALSVPVRVLPLPGLAPHGDVTDWITDGHDAAELATLAAAAPLWTAGASVDTASDASVPGSALAARIAPERRRLDQLLADPALLAPPTPVVPRLAWAGRSTLLVAAPKCGKSTLMAFASARVSTGTAMLGGAVPVGTVLIVALEEHVGDLAGRLRHAGADPTRVFLVDTLPVDACERPAALAEHVRAVRPALVVVDTLACYAQPLVESEDRASEMQPVVQALTDLAHAHGTALLIVHHATKAGGYRGSSAIGAAVDVVVEITSPTDDADPSLRMVRVAGRIPVHGFKYRYTGTDIVCADAASVPLVQRVVDCVRANPGISTTRLRAAVGGRAESLDAALDVLVARGFVRDEGEPRGQGHAWMACLAAPAVVGPA